MKAEAPTANLLAHHHLVAAIQPLRALHHLRLQVEVIQLLRAPHQVEVRLREVHHQGAAGHLQVETAGKHV